jgi:hypothetical protein
VAEARLAGLFDAAPERLEGLLESLVDAAAAHPLSDNVTAVALTWLEGNGDDRPYAAAPHDAEPVFDQDLTNCED